MDKIKSSYGFCDIKESVNPNQSFELSTFINYLQILIKPLPSEESWQWQKPSNSFLALPETTSTT